MIEGETSEHKPQLLLTGSRDKTAILWEIGSNNPLITLRGHDNWVRDGVILAAGKYAITSGDDHSIKVWDLTTGICIKTISDAHPHFVTCLTVNRTVPLLATGGVDKSVRIWNCKESL
jgi:platelet-activating factor acetylhydrolase IB subunit alpha